MSGKLLEVKNIDLSYHAPNEETVALKGLSLEVSNGEFAAIVGPSGCGKTSLLSVLCGFHKPSSGEVRIDGRSVLEAQDSVGYMLQHDHLLDWRTIEGNIMLGLEVRKMKNRENKEYALELLERYGLIDFREHYPRELSGGMRQKAALIRTLALRPRILLLDEPFSALDYQTRLRLCDEVYGIIRSEKKTALLVTHDISEAISMSDRIFVFTARPARVRDILDIELSDGETPLERRNAPEFKNYFETIWKELDAEL